MDFDYFRLTLGVWHHIVQMYDGVVVVTYVDGARVE